MDKEVKLKKIPLHLFIETLISIYERGAEYIDIIGVPDKEQDSITIVVRSEYMTLDEETGSSTPIEEEEEEDIIPSAPPPKIDVRHLTDDDLNQLT